MLRILAEVARRRLEKTPIEEVNFQIQLSSFLMSKAVESVNQILPIDKQIAQDLTMNEFEYSFYDKVWTIRNRAYRDDTNDPDVEEALYEKAFLNKFSDINEDNHF